MMPSDAVWLGLWVRNFIKGTSVFFIMLSLHGLTVSLAQQCGGVQR